MLWLLYMSHMDTVRICLKQRVGGRAFGSIVSSPVMTDLSIFTFLSVMVACGNRDHVLGQWMQKHHQ